MRDYKKWCILILGGVFLAGVFSLSVWAEDDFHLPFEKKEESGRVEKMGRATRVREEIFQEIETKFLNGDYTGVINETEKLIDKRRIKGRDEILYLRGRSYLKMGEFEKARVELTEILSKYQRTRILDRAWITMADSYFEEGNTQEAMAGYENVIKNFPSSPMLNIPLFQLAECYRRKGRWQEAKETLEGLRRRYPLSLESQQADTILKNDDFFFSVQVGSYRYESNAQEAKSALKKKGFNAYITKTEMEGQGLYRVKVGRFNTLDEAKEMQGRLKKEGVSSVISP